MLGPGCWYPGGWVSGYQERSSSDILGHGGRWMKTLVDIDEALLREAMSVAAAATKKETVRLALEELIRARRRGLLKTLAGSGIVDMTRAELRQARHRRR